MNTILKYKTPAEDFNSALPLGNGHIGAMVYGGTSSERYSVNEATLWSGFPTCDLENGNPEGFGKVKELMLKNRHREATELLEFEFSGKDTQYYLPLGNIMIETDCGKPEEYERNLDLSTAIHTVSFKGTAFEVHRESFASHPHRVMVIKTKQKGIGITRISFDSLLSQTVTSEDNLLTVKGVAPYMSQAVTDKPTEAVYSEKDCEKGMRYTAIIKVETDGRVEAMNGTLHISDAEDILIFFAVRTSFKDYKTHPYLEGLPCDDICLKDIENALKLDYEQLKKSHLADHSALFSRTNFSITSKTDKYTDEMLLEKTDLARFELLWNMGKYLTIAASREDSQVMNLQGLWNEKLYAPWRSNCTININTEMNYMPTCKLGLFECFRPYTKMVTELAD